MPHHPPRAPQYAGENITTGSNDIAIGSAGANETGVILIGTAGTHNAAYIAGIHGTAPGIDKQGGHTVVTISHDGVSHT